MKNLISNNTTAYLLAFTENSKQITYKKIEELEQALLAETSAEVKNIVCEELLEELSKLLRISSAEAAVIDQASKKSTNFRVVDYSQGDIN